MRLHMLLGLLLTSQLLLNIKGKSLRKLKKDLETLQLLLLKLCLKPQCAKKGVFVLRGLQVHFHYSLFQVLLKALAGARALMCRRTRWSLLRLTRLLQMQGLLNALG